MPEGIEVAMVLRLDAGTDAPARPDGAISALVRFRGGMRFEGLVRRRRSRSSSDNPAVLTFTRGLVVGLRRDSATRSATAIVNEPSPPKITPVRGAAQETRSELSAPTRAELYGAETTIFADIDTDVVAATRNHFRFLQDRR